MDALLAAAAEAWDAPGAVAAESEGELARFSDIGQALAEGGGLSAVQPLATVFHEQGPQAFLKLAQALRRMGMRGPLLALAWSACGEDAARLCERAGDGRGGEQQALVEEVNKAARWREGFAGVEPGPRAALPNPEQVASAAEPEKAAAADAAGAAAATPPSDAAAAGTAALEPRSPLGRWLSGMGAQGTAVQLCAVAAAVLWPLAILPEDVVPRWSQQLGAAACVLLAGIALVPPRAEE